MITILKKILLITKSEDTFLYIKKQLLDLFKNFILIEKYTNSCRSSEFDLIVSSLEDERFEEFPIEKRILANRTLHVSCVEKLLQLPPETTCYIASNTYEASVDSIEMLRNFGIQLNMLPYPSNEDELDKGITTVVTHDAKLIQPENFSTIIEIGIRPLDFSTIVDIAVFLQLPIHTSGVYKATNMDEIIRLNSNLKQSIQQVKNVYQQVEAILNTTQDGIVTTNSTNTIIQVNQAILGFLNKKLTENEVIGRKFEDIFPGINMSSNKDSQLYQINNFRFVVQTSTITLLNGEKGTLIVFHELNKLQQTELEARRKIHGTGFVSKYHFTDLIGQSPVFMETIEKARQLGGAELPVLILGENGTGKELFAHSMHGLSKRRSHPFVPINFAGLPDSLAESELFGYEDGAFTGAKKGGKPGFFELAHNGTIFLDEIGDASPVIQAALLRVLQEKQILRVGGTQLVPVNVRIIAATNKDLYQLVAEGKFREDLYYRLNVLPLNVPPLRERREDIVLLLKHFFTKAMSKSIQLTSEVKKYLLDYPWPGNIRELENTAYYLSAIIKNHIVHIHDLPLKFINTDHKGESSIVAKLETEGVLSEFYWILHYLKEAKQDNLKTGRTSMEAYFKNANDIRLSAEQIKHRMSILKKYKLIETGTTRQGSWITSLGLETFKKIRLY